tara:strand:- start:305 stop:415 length:111 start_codon:yes stop_codon:yes gene_type:complete
MTTLNGRYGDSDSWTFIKMDPVSILIKIKAHDETTN